MDLKKELRIMVKYILPKEQHDNDVIENYVDTLALINEEYVKQLAIPNVVNCVCRTPDPRMIVSENGIHSYCNNCSKTWEQK